MAPLTSASILNNFENALVSYVLYLWKMIWPAGLAAFYPMPSHIAWWEIAGSASVLIVITITAVWKMQKCPYLIAGWLWYLGSLLPVIGFLQVGSQALADRYTYIPLVGIFIILAWGIGDFSTRWRFRTWILAIIGGVAISALATATWFQAGYWKDGITLFEHTIQVTKNNPTAQHNLGVALMNRGNNLAAIDHFHKALQLSPNFKQAYLNMGQAYTNLGESSWAARSFLNAIAIDPNYMPARYRLANAYILSGRLDLANTILSGYK